MKWNWVGCSNKNSLCHLNIEIVVKAIIKLLYSENWQQAKFENKKKSEFSESEIAFLTPSAKISKKIYLSLGLKR